MKLSLLNILSETTVTPPNIPNTLNFWHGGNLDNYNDIIAQKNGRYEYGPGLYLTTHYETAHKYSKGSRKMYLITVQLGNDIQDTFLNLYDILPFINQFVISSKRKEVISIINGHINDDKIKGFIFNNIILNHNTMKPSNTKYLRQFYIDNNIDYEIVSNPFGWGEDMMVLYNMKKIVNIIVVKPTDHFENYNLKN
jgi:hypothetical protein